MSKFKRKIGTGISILFIVIGITLEQNYHKHVTRAVKLYNSKLGIASTTPKFQLGVASTGVGIALKF